MVVLYLATIGNLLVRVETPVKADAIVVLLGKTPERTMEAVYLFREGYADRLIFVETKKEFEEQLLQEHVQVDLGEAIEVSIATQMGVPREAISIIPGQTESTQDEAVAVRDYLKNDSGVNSLLLVTSKSHSYRASLIFEKALDGVGREIRLTSVPSRLDTFDSKTWWKDREEVQEVLSETTKLLNFWLLEQWRL